MEIDFNERLEVPDSRLRFFASYALEDIPEERDVNWPGGKEIFDADYIIEVYRRGKLKTKLATSSARIAVDFLVARAHELHDDELEPFAAMTLSQLTSIENEALEEE